jgi:hypothetical protein
MITPTKTRLYQFAHVMGFVVMAFCALAVIDVYLFH